jgi:hypothetical protein
MQAKSISNNAQYVICIVKLDEQNPTFMQQFGLGKWILAPHNCASCHG